MESLHKRVVALIPFAQQCRWQVLKALIASDKAASEVARDVGMSMRRFQRLMFTDKDFDMRWLADVCWALGLRPQVEIFDPKEAA